MIGGVTVMGILNVTPDSFSDGGRWHGAAEAVSHGTELVAAGADIIDIGGESTRPGAARVDPSVEQQRILPAIRELAPLGVRISVDTINASTARRAVEAGARIINDVSGGLADPAMLAVAAETGADIVLMHWRGFLVADEKPHYDDVVAEVSEHLHRRVDAALAAGVASERIIIDPGLGFSKTAAHNWALLGEIERLTGTPHRVLIGASRKRFIAELTGATDLTAASIATRDAATAAISVQVAQAGGWGVRVHDVAGTVAALRVHAALSSERHPFHV